MLFGYGFLVRSFFFFFFFNDTATTEIYTLSLHDALPILLRDLLGGMGTGKPEHRPRHLGQPARIVEQGADQLGSTSGLALRHDDGGPSVLEVTRILVLVVSRGEESGNEDRRLSRSGELPHRATGARENEIARAERGPKLLREREEAVVRTHDPRQQLVVVARPAKVENRRTGGCEGLQRELVQQPRAKRSAEHEQHRTHLGQTEDMTRFRLRNHSRPLRNRPPRHPILLTATALDRKRQEDATGERRRQAVRQTQVRVGFHQRRGDKYR